MAYFKQCFSSDSNISTIKELAHALASHCPYEVPIASIKIRHLHCEVPSSEIFFSLNATIVGLAVDSEGPENLPSCLGLGRFQKLFRWYCIAKLAENASFCVFQVLKTSNAWFLVVSTSQKGDLVGFSFGQYNIASLFLSMLLFYLPVWMQS
ncbi:hypothetical protein JHK87_051979 [Glycine soja]|nr:hypothetical protein JHK87_051979 [Glycine soja]